MFQKFSFTIEGVSPLMLHNGQLANPLNQWSTAIRELIAKKKSMDLEKYMIELARLEFMGGLYLDDDLEPCIPGENIESCMVEGAQMSKLGKKFKASVMSNGNWKIIYKGPKSPDEMWASHRDKFADTRRVGVNGKSSIQRTRPIFRAWSCAFDVEVNTKVVNRASVVQAIEDAGRVCGLGDFTPKFGRFVLKT